MKKKHSRKKYRNLASEETEDEGNEGSYDTENFGPGSRDAAGEKGREVGGGTRECGRRLANQGREPDRRKGKKRANEGYL